MFLQNIPFSQLGANNNCVGDNIVDVERLELS